MNKRKGLVRTLSLFFFSRNTAYIGGEKHGRIYFRACNRGYKRWSRRFMRDKRFAIDKRLYIFTSK